jgi:pantoate--beta-alanine ligase
MEVIETIAGIRETRLNLKGRLGQHTLGFVPTMGYLHAGHIALVKQAKAENDISAVSIFVNPTQFGPKEDFKTYPRDIKRDLAMLEPHTDIVFIPSDKEMYPAGYNTWVEVNEITDVLEGAIRPGHFKGVTTVVNKLFNIVQPDKAYFGQKDAQQVAVIKKMVKDLNMPLEVVVCPTIREADGLAMSSRNTYLTPEMRKGAPVLYQSLQKAKAMVEAGEKTVAAIRREMTAMIDKEPLGSIEYISFADNETLKEIHTIKPPVLISMAVKFGKTRLIDNLVISN